MCLICGKDSFKNFPFILPTREILYGFAQPVVAKMMALLWLAVTLVMTGITLLVWASWSLQMSPNNGSVTDVRKKKARNPAPKSW